MIKLILKIFSLHWRSFHSYKIPSFMKCIRKIHDLLTKPLVEILDKTNKSSHAVHQIEAKNILHNRMVLLFSLFI
jgi:hypothetical protein